VLVVVGAVDGLVGLGVVVVEPAGLGADHLRPAVEAAYRLRLSARGAAAGEVAEQARATVPATDPPTAHPTAALPTAARSRTAVPGGGGPRPAVQEPGVRTTGRGVRGSRVAARR
jgi:hypothetical protein